MGQTGNESTTNKVVRLVRKAGILRPRDLAAHGIPREYLTRLTERGVLERTGRGLYILANSEITENHDLAEASKRLPGGVVCLISALRFHGLTTQLPYEVWMALDPRAGKPKIDYPRLRIVRFSGEALTEGIEEHVVERVPVRVYNPSKTVADCFKFRNKIGLDVALEALRDCRGRHRCTMDDIWRYARVCRVTNVMRPYLESLA